MDPLNLINLARLMKDSAGSESVRIGLIDGPVWISSSHFHEKNIVPLPPLPRINGCSNIDSTACKHGTFVASILMGRRGTTVPAICPNCTLLVRPIFTEQSGSSEMPIATASELADAIVDCVDAGARVLNMSIGLINPSQADKRRVHHALDYARKAGVIPVVAAGNQGSIGQAIVTQHPWVIAVSSCDQSGTLAGESNLGRSIARWGIRAPGQDIVGLGPKGGPVTASGSSFAVPFVVGALALLISKFPAASPQVLRAAILGSQNVRKSIVPPLFNAEKAYAEIKRYHYAGV